MKKFNYEQYDYSFLYGLLTEKQRESLQIVLNQFIGYPNTEMTRCAVRFSVEMWMIKNDKRTKSQIATKYYR